MSDNAGGASLLKATTKEQQRYSMVNQGIVQDVGVLGAEGASDDV